MGYSNDKRTLHFVSFNNTRFSLSGLKTVNKRRPCKEQVLLSIRSNFSFIFLYFFLPPSLYLSPPLCLSFFSLDLFQNKTLPGFILSFTLRHVFILLYKPFLIRSNTNVHVSTCFKYFSITYSA
jgi:hypothetical protein